MKKLAKNTIYLLLGVFLTASLAACDSIERSSEHLTHTLHERQQYAEAETKEVLRLLRDRAPLDSVVALTQSDDHLLYYIYEDERLVYWSDNWLSASNLNLTDTVTGWWYAHFENAHAVARWTCADHFHILTIIPVKYDYAFSNRQLHNTFIPPFSIDDHYQITSPSASDSCVAIPSLDGQVLFALTDAAPLEPLIEEQGPLMNSFSYRQLVSPDGQLAWWHSRRMRVRVYTILIVSICCIILLLGVVGLVRNRGFRNMKLRTQFVYVMISVILVGFVYIFAMSARYVRRSVEHRQRRELEKRTLYIQSHLESLYFDKTEATELDAAELSADLLRLSYIYSTDIHVYDRDGSLMATSSPELFQKGLVSTLMATAPYFSGDSLLICYEQIGDMRYLAGYIPLINSHQERVGYLSVPSFVSEFEVSRQVDGFLSRLLPPYILLLVLTLIVSYFVSRSLTRPLRQLELKMSQFRLGRADNRIDYHRNDELGQFVQRYNELVDQVEQASMALARSEREGAWRTMARQIAHEINNPLTPMKLNLQQLERLHGTERFDAYFERTCRMLISEIDNLSHIATSFSDFAKMPEVVVTRADVAQKLSSVITLFTNNEEHIPIRYVGPDAGVWVRTDAEQITQVFTNLIKNAIQAMSHREGSDLIVILNAAYSPDEIEVRVSDNGPGIADEWRDKVFMPNFTTKTTGTGLGLAISKNIVEASGGKICFETSKKGTTFFVYLKKMS